MGNAAVVTEDDPLAAWRPVRPHRAQPWRREAVGRGSVGLHHPDRRLEAAAVARERDPVAVRGVLRPDVVPVAGAEKRLYAAAVGVHDVDVAEGDEAASEGLAAAAEQDSLAVRGPARQEVLESAALIRELSLVVPVCVHGPDLEAARLVALIDDPLAIR